MYLDENGDNDEDDNSDDDDNDDEDEDDEDENDDCGSNGTDGEIHVAVETSEDRRNRNETGWSPTLPAHNASSLLFLVGSWNTEVARKYCTAETGRPDRNRGFEDIPSITLDLHNSANFTIQLHNGKMRLSFSAR